MSSWCDKLASVPSVGFKFATQYESSDSLLDAFAPLFARWTKDDTQNFKIDKREPFGLQFHSDDGFHYGVDHTRMFVDFRHSMKAKSVSGGPPVVEMLSHPLPYTKLLPEVSKRLLEATALLPVNKANTLHWLGVIANTSVDEDDLPPGITRLIQYVGKPWKGKLENYNFQIVSQIAEAPTWIDRCIHTIAKPDDPENPLLTVTFDWQRYFRSPRSVTAQSLEQLTAEGEQAAMKYFEDLAEGNRFDEEIIVGTTRV